MLDLHRLRVLRSVVASGSVGAAAVNLGYTPSAVSQHLAALQRETGLVLLERSGRGVRPTDAGLALAAEAEGVLERLGEAEARVADLRSARTSTLSLAYFASVGAAWMPEVVAGLSEAFPHVRLDLRLVDEAPEDPADRADVQVVVARQRFDAGTGFAVHHLLDDPYVVVLRDDHPFTDRAGVELGDIAGERLVDNDFSRGWCRKILLEAFATAGAAPVFHVEAHDYRAAIAFVAVGIGVTVMPALGAVELPAGVVALPVLRPVPVRSIHVIVRDPLPSPAADLAVRLLERAAAARSALAPTGR